MTGSKLFAGLAAACLMALPFQGLAQTANEPAATPNVPAPGEPRAQEALPEAPPEKMLKTPPPIETKKPEAPPSSSPPQAEPKAPAEPVKPRVPNT